MEKVIKEILGQIPKFVISFIDLVQSPKKFVKNTASLGSESISDASIFLGLSLAITYLIKSPHFAKIKDFDVFTYILKDGLWKLIIIILISISLSLTWRILKRNISTIQFFIINSYFFGVFSILVHAFFVMANVLNEPNPNISIALLVIGYLFVLVWGLISFSAYTHIQEGDKINFIKSLLIFFIVSTPFIFLGVVFRDALVLGDTSYLKSEGILSIIGRFFHYTVI